MTDARRCAVWPDTRSRSRSWLLESHSRGVDRQSRTWLVFFYNTCRRGSILWCRSIKLLLRYGDLMVFGRPFVKRFALCHRTVILSVCLSVCLSVIFVHCGQTVGRIKMELSKQVGLDPGHIVLDGDTSPLPQRGGAPNFRPISVAAKWLDGSRCHLVWW